MLKLDNAETKMGVQKSGLVKKVIREPEQGLVHERIFVPSTSASFALTVSIISTTLTATIAPILTFTFTISTTFISIYNCIYPDYYFPPSACRS